MPFPAAVKLVGQTGLTGNQDALKVVETFANKGRKEAIDALKKAVKKHGGPLGAAKPAPGEQASPVGDRIWKMTNPVDGQPATSFPGAKINDVQTILANRVYSLKALNRKVQKFKNSLY